MVTVNVVGRLGADAEIKNSEKGRLVTLRLATDDFVDGQKTTAWFSVAIRAEALGNIVPYLTKGKMVQVIGKERVRLYTDRNGETKVARDIFAHSVEFISGASGNTKSDSAEVVSETTPTTDSTPQTSTDVNSMESAMACGTFRPTPQSIPTPAMSVANSSATDVDDLPF